LAENYLMNIVFIAASDIVRHKYKGNLLTRQLAIAEELN